MALHLATIDVETLPSQLDQALVLLRRATSDLRVTRDHWPQHPNVLWDQAARWDMVADALALLETQRPVAPP